MAYALSFSFKSSGATLQLFEEKGGVEAHARNLTSKKANFLGTVVTDVNSPEFDLEKFLLKISKESP